VRPAALSQETVRPTVSPSPPWSPRPSSRNTSRVTFQEHFEGYDSKLPKALAALASFDSKLKGECCSGYFELETADAIDWFPAGSEIASQFVVFGQNADGGLYAYWLHDGLPADKAPIAYLGSEGGAVVLANSTEDFLRLLAVGADELGPAAGRGSIEPPTEPSSALKAFRKWLKEKFDLTMPKDAMKLVEKAQASHPDLTVIAEGGDEGTGEVRGHISAGCCGSDRAACRLVRRRHVPSPFRREREVPRTQGVS